MKLVIEALLAWFRNVTSMVSPTETACVRPVTVTEPGNTLPAMVVLPTVVTPFRSRVTVQLFAPPPLP